MYSFTSKRKDFNNENIFSHRMFVKGDMYIYIINLYSNALNQIKRKKKKLDNNEVKANIDAVSLMFDQSLTEKQLSKKNYRVAINLLLNKINELKIKQHELERNSNVVIKHNHELMRQNEYLIREIKSSM